MIFDHAFKEAQADDWQKFSKQLQGNTDTSSAEVQPVIFFPKKTKAKYKTRGKEGFQVWLFTTYGRQVQSYRIFV